MLPDSQIVPCLYCSGEGRVYQGHPNDPEPRSARCPICRGAGLEEVIYTPAERDDDLNDEPGPVESILLYGFLALIAIGLGVVCMAISSPFLALMTGASALGFMGLIIDEVGSA